MLNFFKPQKILAQEKQKTTVSDYHAFSKQHILTSYYTNIEVLQVQRLSDGNIQCKYSLPDRILCLGAEFSPDGKYIALITDYGMLPDHIPYRVPRCIIWDHQQDKIIFDKELRDINPCISLQPIWLSKEDNQTDMYTNETTLFIPGRGNILAMPEDKGNNLFSKGTLRKGNMGSGNYDGKYFRFSPSGHYDVAFEWSIATLQLMELTSERKMLNLKFIGDFNSNSPRVKSIHFSENNYVAVSWTYDKQSKHDAELFISIFDIKKEKHIYQYSFKQMASNYRFHAFLPNTSQIAIVFKNNIKVIDFDIEQLIHTQELEVPLQKTLLSTNYKDILCVYDTNETEVCTVKTFFNRHKILLPTQKFGELDDTPFYDTIIKCRH